MHTAPAAIDISARLLADVRDTVMSSGRELPLSSAVAFSPHHGTPPTC
jgi:hypothetical protein